MALEHVDFVEFAARVAAAAGAAILPHFREAIAVEDKGGARGYDPVTEADRAAEAVIREAIARAYPDHGIFGEEHGREQGTSKYTWVIDPIDGHLVNSQAVALGEDQELGVEEPAVIDNERQQPTHCVAARCFEPALRV